MGLRVNAGNFLIDAEDIFLGSTATLLSPSWIGSVALAIVASVARNATAILYPAAVSNGMTGVPSGFLSSNILPSSLAAISHS